jgi:hypothetical protein
VSLEHSPARQNHTSSRASFSINEFCQRHGFSRSFWYKLKRLGLTPDVTLLNNMQRITPDAEKRWLAERETTG